MRTSPQHPAGQAEWPRISAALVVVIAGCARVLEPAAITLGPERELLIHAEVNDRPCVLQLDTGASTTSFTRVARGSLRLRGAFPATGGGAGGALADVQWVLVRKLRFAGELTRGLMATVVDLDPAGGAIDGVLGMDVLGDYTFEVDTAARRLVLHREGDAGVRTDDLVAADYTPLRGGQIALAIRIGGRAATAVLDLGANHTFANHRVSLTPDDADLSIIAAIGADRHPLQFQIASHVTVELAGLALPARSVWISDLPIFHTFGLSGQPAVVLGTDVLAGRRIIVDPFARRVYLSR